MITLTYGYKKPEANDKGPIVFPAQEQNIQQLNDHNHDGANSKRLTTASIDAVPQTISAVNWVSLGGGNYHQQVTLLPGYSYDTTTLSFRDISTGAVLYPSVLRVSPTSMNVFSNDGVSDMLVLYGV